MTSVDKQEVEKFAKMAATWWDETGPMAPLHQLNPLRLKYIKQNICKYFELNEGADKPLKGLNILDIGCGAGLLCEPLTRLGASVTGIDATSANIEAAKAHTKQSGLKISYINTTAEELLKKGKQYDVVLNMEVIEHVANPAEFASTACNLMADKSIQFISTINRTPKSYLFAILGAEYILRLLPRGTHSWAKFLKPSEIAQFLQAKNLTIDDMVGVKYNPFTKDFSIIDDVSVNYMLHSCK